MPRTSQAIAWQALEIELTAHFRVGSARMRYIVRIERHHVREQIGVSVEVYIKIEVSFSTVHNLRDFFTSITP